MNVSMRKPISRDEFGGFAPIVPAVIFESFGETSASTDRVVNREHQDTPSVPRYVVLEQFRPAATVLEPVAHDWIGHVLHGDVVLRMPESGIELPLSELSDGVKFPETLEGN